MKLPDALVYNAAFYEHQAVEVASSAVPVLRFVFDQIQPKSVVDVGCGSGGWLKTCQDFGVTDLVGIEGPWARNNPVIPKGAFVEADLTMTFPAIGRRFDLAINLEVAEHLPESRARELVKYLTSLAPVVLFSAAIPGQGGANHINERWQSYWAQLFLEQGYAPNLELRHSIWANDRVAWWYRQNAIVYTVSGQFTGDLKAIDAVHPGYATKYMRIIGVCNWVASFLPQGFKNLIVRLFL